MQLRSFILISLILSFAHLRAFGETQPELSKERMILHTNFGDIVMAFYPTVAPRHTAQILRMARAGVYDGTQFFRLEKGFVVQVDTPDMRKIPLTPEQKATVEKIPDEFSDVHHRRGILSMAKYDEANSAEASYSIVLGEAPHLDHHYTVFGEVTQGMDVVSAIENVGVNGTGSTQPLLEVLIQKAEVVDDASLLDVSKLRGVQETAMPSEQSTTIFEIIAGLTFSVMIAAPFVKTIAASKRGARPPAKS